MGLCNVKVKILSGLSKTCLFQKFGQTVSCKKSRFYYNRWGGRGPLFTVFIFPGGGLPPLHVPAKQGITPLPLCRADRGVPLPPLRTALTPL